jgi:hypothetical protein
VAQNFQPAFRFLFGCWHRKLSRPFTLSGRKYEACLSCGTEFAYARVDFGRSFPKRKKEETGLDKLDVSQLSGRDDDRRRDLDSAVDQRTHAIVIVRSLFGLSRIACNTISALPPQ